MVTSTRTKTSNRGKEHMNHNALIPNNRKCWARMAIYWSIGWLVGTWKGYSFSSIIQKQQQLTKWHIAALIVTYETHRIMDSRQSNFGRKRSWLGVIIFSIMNGIFETFMILASFDVGHDLVFLVALPPLTNDKTTLTPTKMIANLVGFTTFSIYSALIHDKFWMPLALPRHVKPDASPFHKSGLPALTVMSIFWLLILYDASRHENILAVCVLHILFDALGMAAICLPSPFEK